MKTHIIYEFKNADIVVRADDGKRFDDLIIVSQGRDGRWSALLVDDIGGAELFDDETTVRKAVAAVLPFVARTGCGLRISQT